MLRCLVCDHVWRDLDRVDEGVDAMTTIDDLPEILEKHRLWLSGDGGQCANLARANLAGAYLSGAYLSGAYLSGADLAGANLSGVNLSGADLSGADLDGANLAGANLAGANLDRANLAEANLDGANLDRANLDGANLDRADLTRANLSGANLSGAKWDSEGAIKTTIAPVMFYGSTWPIMIFDRHIMIGCQTHTTEEWAAFDDKAIARMDGTNARQFWRQWETAILAMAEAHQSKVTEGEME
jgi:hypothetical protein